MKWSTGAAAAALVVAGLCSGVAQGDSVKVGLIASYTGAFATWGTQFQQAVEAYQALHGKTIKGPDGTTHEIQFVYRDTASQGPDKAKQLAEELILRERVKFLTGLELSPYAMVLGDLSQQAKIPVVIMNAGAAPIVRGSPYFVRVSFTAAQFSIPGARWAAKTGFKTGYIIVSDYAPGHEAEPYFAKGFEEGGGKIIGKARTPQQETNFSAYMEKVLQAKPDVLFMFQPTGSPSVAFVRAYVERGLKAAGIKLIGTGETQQLFLPNFTDDVIGVVSSFPYTETNTRPENASLKAQLAKLFGDKAEPDIASVEAWDGTDLIYQAVGNLGPNAEGLKYIDFMKGKKLNSPRGPIMIDPETRDIIQNMYIRQVEKRAGRLVNVDIGVEEMVKDPWKIDNPPK
jgi:branched-chain amino acid transport system substrate-binding protein